MNICTRTSAKHFAMHKLSMTLHARIWQSRSAHPFAAWSFRSLTNRKRWNRWINTLVGLYEADMNNLTEPDVYWIDRKVAAHPPQARTQWRYVIVSKTSHCTKAFQVFHGYYSNGSFICDVRNDRETANDGWWFPRSISYRSCLYVIKINLPSPGFCAAHGHGQKVVYWLVLAGYIKVERLVAGL